MVEPQRDVKRKGADSPARNTLLASLVLVDLFSDLPQLFPSGGGTSPTCLDYVALRRMAKDSKNKPFPKVAEPATDSGNICLSRYAGGEDDSDSDDDRAVNESHVRWFEEAWLLTPEARQRKHYTTFEVLPFPGEPPEVTSARHARAVAATAAATAVEDVDVGLPNAAVVRSPSHRTSGQPGEFASVATWEPSPRRHRTSSPHPPPEVPQPPLQPPLKHQKLPLSDLSQKGWFRVVAPKGAKARGFIDMDAGEAICALPQGAVYAFSAAEWCVPKPDYENILVPVVRLRAEVPGLRGEAWISLTGRNVGPVVPIAEIMERSPCPLCDKEVACR